MSFCAFLLCALLAPARAQDPAVASELLGEIEAYDTQITQLDAQISTLETTLAVAEAERTKREGEAKAAEATVASRSGGARALLGNLYRIRRFGMLRLLFGAEDPVELRRRASYLRAVLTVDESRSKEFAALAEEKHKSAAASEVANASTRQLRDQLAAQRLGLDTERVKRVALLRDVRGRPSFAGQYTTEVTRAHQDFDASVQSREASIPPVIAAPANVDFRSLRGRLPKPVNGRVLHGFGPMTDPLTGAKAMNPGIDWAAEPGAVFRAVADGTVTRAGYQRGYGQIVMIQHGSYSTLYAHGSSTRMSVDQAVRAGDVLGTVGTTGLADDTTPQLHFELRYNGTPQDPAEWLVR